MSYRSDTDPPTGGSNPLEEKPRLTGTRAPRARPVGTSGTQTRTRTQERTRNASRTRTKASEKKPRGDGYSSTDYTDDDWDPLPLRQHHSHRGFPDRRRGRLDSALPPTGYYGNDRPTMNANDGAVTVWRIRPPGFHEKSPTLGSSSLNDVDVVWNVSSTRDVTLHLELDVEDDIDANLREFVLFTRRGDYKRAEQYYQDNLACHSEQPEVLVEYVRMLVDKGSYKAIRDLGISEFDLENMLCSPTAPKTSQAVQLLLLLHKARSLSEPNMEYSHNAFIRLREFVRTFRRVKEEAEVPQPLNPAMIQLLLLYVDLAQTINLQSNMVADLSPVEAILSLSLRVTYTDLLSDSRCWEIRDTIITSLKAFGVIGTFSEIFPTNHIADALSRFMADWETMERDELSDLALLDILNSISRFKDEPGDLPPDPHVEIAHQTASNLARLVTTSIKDNNPQLMKSRSYLEWLLLEEAKERHKTKDPKVKSLTVAAYSSFPGKVLSYTDAFVYVPADSENPGWLVSSCSDLGDKEVAIQLLSTARKTAQELGSYNLETECLHELTCQSVDPDKYLTELERFHISVKSGQFSLLKTRLMRYLMVAGSDDKTRQLLKSQLLELDPGLQSARHHFSHPLWEWAYGKVRYALMCSLGEGDTEGALAVLNRGRDLVYRLPWWARGAPRPERHAYFGPMGRERYRGGMGNIPRPTFRSPSPPSPPSSPSPPPPARQRGRSQPVMTVVAPPREGPRIEEERGSRESKPSQSRERLRPERDREYLELKRQLEEYRNKQNEIIRKRAEEERLKELEEEVKRKAQEEVHRVYEQKARMAELARIEGEKARAMAEMEMRERLLREEEESRRRKRDEEELRARIKTEIMAEFAAKERAKEENMAREAKIRTEARQLFELERKAKKEAAAAKRKAKKEQEAKEAEMYLEAEANAREKILAELKAGVPRRKLRAILGISEYESEGSDVERRLIEEGAHSDSDSSVESRRREARRHTRRSRRCSSSCSSCSTGDGSGDRARRSDSTRRVIVERYRMSPGGSMYRVDVDGLGVGQENEIAVIEEQPQTEPVEREGFEESQEAAAPPEPERAPESITKEELEGPTTMEMSWNENAKVADRNEEVIEGQNMGKVVTTITVPEGGQGSSDDFLSPEEATDGAMIDNENDLDIYD